MASLAVFPSPAFSQFGRGGQFQLADAVSFDTPDGAAQAHLERFRQYRAVEQWEEAVETLLHVMDHYGDQVILLYQRPSLSGYTSVRNYCHWQLSRLPPEALRLYRRRVDAQAEKWFADGIATRDADLLTNVVQQMFCSSRGDDALAALAELALEKGRFSTARYHWERVIPGGGSPESPVVRVTYPDSDLDLAGIQARLVWVSILEGARHRARGELDHLTQTYPGASGRFGGRRVELAAHLAALLESAESWPVSKTTADWKTFAGNPARNRVMPRAGDVGQPAWEPILLDPISGSAAGNGLFSPVRVAEGKDALLSYHPLASGNLLLVNGRDRILAFDIHTGKPAWGSSAEIYPGGTELDPRFGGHRRHRSRGSLGAARFTMSVFADRLYSRMGNPVTSHSSSDQFVEHESGELVCLDLSAQGRLAWKISPEGDKWAFEGSPLADGANVYVAMRRSDVTPQAHVACFDAATGQRHWRRFVCAAQTPGRGRDDEITHNLLTLHQGVIYYNTNLGAVVALEADSGRVRWISRYARAAGGDLTKPASHFYRDLNPCVYYQGKILVAPSDSEHIFALEATTGRLLWATPPNVDDAVHLLGVGAGKLWASGDRLWWIDVENGKLLGVWPDQSSPKGYGRGLLAGDKVLWPTRRRIHVFDQHTGRPVKKHDLRFKVPLGEAGGGNLILSDGYLVVATGDRLRGFVEFSRLKKRAASEVTARPDSAAAHFLLARCEEALHQWEAAARCYRRAIELATKADRIEGRSLSRMAAARLYDLLIVRGRHHGDRRQWPVAREFFDEAIRTAPTPRDELTARLTYADVLLSADYHALAVEQLQTILVDPRLAPLDVAIDGELTQRAATAAKARIAQVIAENRGAGAAGLKGDDLPAAQIVARRTVLPPPKPQETRRPHLPPMRRWAKFIARPIIVPHGMGQAFDLRYVLVDDDGWSCLDGKFGQTRFSLPFDDTPLWSGVQGDVLLVATKSDVWGLNRDDGAVVFHAAGRELPAETITSSAAPAVGRLRGFRLMPHGLIVRQSDERLVALDTQCGKVIWRFQPPNGLLTDDVYVNGSYVVARTTEPAETTILQADSGAVMHRIFSPTAAWRRPLMLDARHCVVVDQSDRITMFDLDHGHATWSRAGGRQSGGAPDVIAHGGALIGAMADGRVMRLDPEYGTPRWNTALSGNDTSQTRFQGTIALDETSIYCSAGGKLKAYDLADAAPRWQQLLSQPSCRWRLARRGDYLTAVSVEADEDRPLEILTIDPADGRLVHRMRFAVAPRDAQVLLDDEAGVVVANDRIWYFD